MTPEEGEAVRKLAARAAHDFAGILTVVTMACALMSEEQNESSRQMLVLDMEASCIRGRHLIEQLLNDLRPYKANTKTR